MSSSPSTSSSYMRIPFDPPSPSTPFPYSPTDLRPYIQSSDVDFYSEPRFVTHIDDAAIVSLSDYYDTALPKRGRILDLCSSWISHYPPSVEDAVAAGQLEVVGLGMNVEELGRNEVLRGKWGVKDLNAEPGVWGWKGDPFLNEKGAPRPLLNATTCVVSIDYLTQPVQVLQSIRERTVKDGTVHLAISNRCFPTKVVRRWLEIDEEERLKMVGNYLWYAGWREVEILVLSDGTVGQKGAKGTMGAFMAGLGMGRRDPLWIVRAKNVE